MPLPAIAVAAATSAASTIVDTISEILRRFIPDPEQAAKALQEILGILQTSDQGQVEINKIEAASSSLFVAGWRPALGWGGVVGVWYAWLIRPLLEWLSVNVGWLAPPQPDLSELLTLLFGLLGLAAYRTVERVRGVIPKGQ